jgi:hypothetical protein
MEATGTAKARLTSQSGGPQTHQQSSADGRFGPEEPSAHRTYYGLPCANCGTYYESGASVCPICKSSERVSPTAIPKSAIAAAPEPVPEVDELEQERERFLKEFKAQLFAAHSQINAAASFRCSLEQNHSETNEPAAICKPCYERVQEKADRLEAALHIDLKEAAQIVYEAVWADSSDPGKTYANAAQALLTELRKRAGVNTVLTTLQPYAN